MPYSYYITQPADVLTRLNENWIRLYLLKTLKSWQRISNYDYNTYVLTNTATGDTREVCLFDAKTPSIEQIREVLKCGV